MTAPTFGYAGTEIAILRESARRLVSQLPDATTRDAIATLMATHGHTLTVEQRAAVRGWLGRTA